MSNLSNRVAKAKKLTFSHNKYEPGRYQTWGSEDEEYGEKYYRITLSHKMETITTPDTKKNILTLLVDCQKDTGNGQPTACPDCQYNKAVCKHGLGALYNSFKDSGKLISFFKTYESAVKMAFGGKIAKVQSVNGKGFVWAIIKDWPEKKWIREFKKNKPEMILSVEENINLMRGSEDDEGID